jgi:Calcineurin-like phosphoesterase
MANTSTDLVFGLIADIQFASDRPDFHKSGERVLSYRASLGRLDRALREILTSQGKAEDGHLDRDEVSCIVTLGDIVEGSVSGAVGETVDDVKAVLEVFGRACARGQGKIGRRKRIHVPVLHTIGNHCRNIPRDKLVQLLGIAGIAKSRDDESSNAGWGYFSFSPRHVGNKWTFLILNGAELCTGSVDATAADEAEMRRLLSTNAEDEVPDYYSGISAAQLEWFRQSVVAARADGRYVVVFSHYALARGAARATHVLANGDDVVRVIADEGRGVVRAVFAGHDHCGGALAATEDGSGGVQHITLQAMLEAGDGGTAHAVVRARADGSMTVEGYGNVPSYDIGPVR